MSTIFDSVRNYHEDAVFRLILDRASEYPTLAGSPELLADVACVALNRVPPRYACHRLEMTFYMEDAERIQNEAAVRTAVDFALRFVEARAASKARG